MYVVETKKSKLEPFIHWEIATVRASETITDEDKQKKEFFGEWVKTLTDEEIYTKDLETLRKERDEYINKIKIKDV